MVRWQILSLLLLLLTITQAFRFDQDTGENCSERATAQDCSKDKVIYFQCPITCAHALEPKSGAAATSSGPMDDEAFYELKVTDTKGKTISFENYQGYVTVIATIPLLEGVAQFHYEMLEHLHDVYPYTLEIIVIPLKGKAKIVPHEKPKVTLLSGGDGGGPHAPVLDLLQKSLREGIDYDDKVTLYLVGADGNSVEAFVSTTMPDFQRYLRYHFVKDLSEHEL